MDSPKPESAAPYRRPWPKIELPWLILGALLLSTLVAAYQNARQLRADAVVRFNEIAAGEARLVTRQMRDIENLMQGTAAHLAAVPKIDRPTWDAYFDARMPAPGQYDGLVALQYLPADMSPTALNQSGTPLTRLFAVQDAQQAKRTIPPLKSLAPVAQAMSEAGDRRSAVLSARLGSIPGIATRGATHALAKPAAHGYLIGIIDLDAMMASLARERTLPVTQTLTDRGETTSAAADPTGDAGSQMSVDIPIEFGTKTLTLRVNSTPALEGRLQNNTPRTILLIGVLGTVLLGGLIWLLTRLREQAEALAASMTRKLQDQTKFTEDLIEFNPSPIFRKDIQGNFVSVNRAWEQLSGRNRQDIIGKSYREFQQLEIAEQNEMLDETLLNSDTGYEMVEAFITNAGGKQFETIVAKQVIRGTDGKVEGLIGTITDVTPIKRLERELAQQREQLNLVIRSSQQGIWDVEVAAGGSHYYSPRFREILGYADGGFPVNFDWKEALHPEDAAAFRAHIVSHFKSETPLFDIESRVLRKDGSYAWVRARAIAQRDAKGRAVRFVGSISDVTDRKEAEMKLVDANVRVMQAARAKESFLATMSHEIRTPLNGVLGMTSLLSETRLNDEQRDYIRLIRASGDTLLRLIDDVLDFSKIESGHMTLESVPVEVVLVVEEAFELVAEKAREKDLALLFDISDDVPYYILADATRLRQILLNLLANAIKFTAKGEIKLSLDARRTADGDIELEGRILDTGIGIPADRASKLFQPFTQVDASTTRKYGGTGLGLAICRRLTQLMGGDIRVESVEGKGSVFIFTIQTELARGPLKPYMQRDVFDFAGKRLLVVDRNSSRRPILVKRYSRWGFTVTAVDHADAAETLRRGPPFNVLLTDMVLPSPESSALQAALADDDVARARNAEPLVASVLQSTVSRAELSARGIKPPLRHDIFIMRPARRARLFDVLLRAVLHEPNQDIATRPFTAEQVYEREFQSNLQATNHSQSGPTSSTTQTAPQRHRSNPLLPRGTFVLNALVAEDNEINQRVVQGMLENLGHRITVVGDGRSAVERAVSEAFDVVLMDIHMPELDGVEAMREIRRQLAGKLCPPIVAMTAHALSGDRERYLDAGMDDYLSKPIRTADLVKLLERVNSRTMAAPWADRGSQHVAIPVSTGSGLGSAPANQHVDNVAVLDIEQLEDLRYLPSSPGEPAVENDPVGGLIRLFQSKAIERMKLMEGMLADRNWHGLSEISHSLRGASASMGFPRVAVLCKDLELLARSLENAGAASVATTTLADLTKLLEQIKLYYAEADQALTIWLASTALAPASRS